MSYIRDNKSHFKEDFDASISNDSVFDWGGPLALPNADEDRQGSSDDHVVSRYDPNTMNRIADIADLVDDSSGTDSDDDDAIIGRGSSMGATGADLELEYGIKRYKQAQKQTNNYGPTEGVVAGSNALFCRRSMTIVSLVAIILAASLSIGYSVLRHPPPRTVENNAILSEQKLLEIAERIVAACSEQSLDADVSECQNLCHSNMCCFESGEDSCQEDERRGCAVYAGCEALVEGVPLGAAEEDEE